MTLTAALEKGQQRLEEIRREVGYDPQDGEPVPWEVIERYIEQLEAALVAEVGFRDWSRRQRA